jgi:hypothetical protein
MPDTDLIPDLRWTGVKDHTFSKTRRQRSCPLPGSLSITMSRDRLLHFQCKKTSRPIPQLFQRSKVVSINLPILPFFKFKIRKFLQVLMTTRQQPEADTGHRFDLCLSVYLNCPEAGEGWGEVWNFLLLIENFMEHGSWTVSHAQTEIQRPTLRNLDQNEKLWTIIKILTSTTIFVDRCRSQSLGIVSMQKTSCPIPRFFQRSKVVGINRMILPFF